MIINGMNVIAFYPGRFQPMGVHHRKTWEWTCSVFGHNNSFIVSSDKTDPSKSPLRFVEKRDIANAHGIPEDRFIHEKTPYVSSRWNNIPTILSEQSLNYKNCIYVFVVGQKDMNEDARFRVGMKKRNPNEPTYFQHFNPDGDLKSAEHHAYLIVAPHESHILPNGKESSGTNLREILATSSQNEFEKSLGFYDSNLHEFLKRKFLPSAILSESKRVNFGEAGFDIYIDSLIDELSHIKSTYNSRTKAGNRYRKEASIIQNAISELRRQKRKHEKKLLNSETLKEGIDRRNNLKDWFRK